MRGKEAGDEVMEYERLFMALADRTRLRLLNLMRGGEVCVCYLVEVLGESQPKISRHLAFLRRAGLVSARREGKWMHYRMVEPDDRGAAGVMAGLLDWLSEDKGMQRDRRRMLELSCMTSPPVQLQGAPKPVVKAAKG